MKLQKIFRRIGAVLGLGLLLTSFASAQLSPDQQKQIDDLKNQFQSGQISIDEMMKKIQAITSQIQNHLGAAPGTQKTIPVTLTVSTTWHSQNDTTNKDGTSAHDSQDGHISVTATGNMMAVVNGTANFKDMSAGGASHFIIQCTTLGSGHATWQEIYQGDPKGLNGSNDHVLNNYQIDGGFSSAANGASLFTTGSDALFVNSDGGGIFKGNRHTHTHWDGEEEITTSDGKQHVEHRAHDNDNDDQKVADVPKPPYGVGSTMEGYETQTLGSKVTVFPKPVLQFSYKALAAAIAKGTTTTLTSSEGFSFNVGTTMYSGNGTVSITLNPKPVQLVVEPDDPTGYEKWLPLPGTDDNQGFDFKGATPMKVHLVLAKPGAASGKGKTSPNADVSGKFDIYLTNVDQNPGVCMNFPQQGPNGPNKPGLYFPDKQPDGIVRDSESHVHTTGLVQEATVVVNVRDTAAYGQISAKCDELQLQSTYIPNGRNTMDIPEIRDGDSSHIAKYWLTQNNVNDKDADWDACASKSGWVSSGDGISLYDKYRGVLVDDGSGTEQFSRVDPTVQNLFIYLPGAFDSPGGDAQAGAPHKDLLMAGCALYAASTKVKVTYLHSGDRLMNLNANYPRWITFNQTSHSKVKQCAVVIYDDGKPWDMLPGGGRHEAIGTTYSLDGVNDAVSHDPTMVSRIIERYTAAGNQIDTWVAAMLLNNPPESSAAFVRRLNETCRQMGLDPTQVGNTAKGNRDQLVNGMIVFSTAHELGHATGAQHHGLNANGTESDNGDDLDCPMRYWQGIWIGDENVVTMDTVDLLAGKWDLSLESPKNHPWKFCNVDCAKMKIKPAQ